MIAEMTELLRQWADYQMQGYKPVYSACSGVFDGALLEPSRAPLRLRPPAGLGVDERKLWRKRVIAELRLRREACLSAGCSAGGKASRGGVNNGYLLSAKVERLCVEIMTLVRDEQHKLWFLYVDAERNGYTRAERERECSKRFGLSYAAVFRCVSEVLHPRLYRALNAGAVDVRRVCVGAGRVSGRVLSLGL